jgi:hypothetical protein
MAERALSQMGLISPSLYPPTPPYSLILNSDISTESNSENAISNPNSNCNPNSNSNSNSNSNTNSNSNSNPNSSPISASKEIFQLIEVIFYKKIKNNYLLKSKKVATNLINNLFLARYSDIVHTIKNIPYIPNIIELKAASNILRKELSGLNLDQNLRLGLGLG